MNINQSPDNSKIKNMDVYTYLTAHGVNGKYYTLPSFLFFIASFNPDNISEKDKKQGILGNINLNSDYL